MDYYDIFTGELPEAFSNDELKKCFERYKNGSLEAKNEIIEHNIRFVIHIVKNRFNNTEYDEDELISIGITGLIKAVESFNVEKNAKFSSYANKCIINEILMFIRKNKKSLNNISLQKSIGQDKNGHELLLEETLKDENADFTLNYEAKDELQYYSKIIPQALDLLPPLGKKVILLRYGFNNNKIYKQQEIASILNISRSYVAKLIDSNVKKLKKIIEDIEQGKINIKEFDSKKVKKCIGGGRG